MSDMEHRMQEEEPGEYKVEGPDRETEADTPATKPAAAPSASSAASGGQGMLWGIAVLLLLGMLVAAYFISQQLEQRMDRQMAGEFMPQLEKTLEARLEQSLQQQLGQVRQQQEQQQQGQSLLQQENRALREQLEKFQSEQARLAEQQTRDGLAVQQVLADSKLLSKSVEQVNESIGRNRNSWILAEAEYLLQLASRRLTLERDVRGAVAALQATDQRLSSLNEPALTRVRGLVNDELQQLRALPLVDAEGMALELVALARGVDQLVLKVKKAEDIAGDIIGESDEKWRQILQALWKDLRGLLIIRRNESSDPPLLTPEQRQILQENLRLKLEGARLSLLRGQGQAYRDALQEADAWLERFFDPASSATGSMHEALQRLAAVEIAPELPVLEEALRELRDAATRLEQGSTS